MNTDWSPEEKKVARTIFDRAAAKARSEYLERHRAKKIGTIDELWAYELEIREWRREYQRIFQFTYSLLDACFSVSLMRGWLTPDDLRGLREERANRIRMLAKAK